MIDIHGERLLKLAGHIESGKLGHDRFDFGHISVKAECGTLGCAMGELPFCFPEAFKFTDWRPNGFGWPVARSPIPVGCEDKFAWLPLAVKELHGAVQEFFGLTTDERRHLFEAGYQMGGFRLDTKAEAWVVAGNIRVFVHRKYHVNKELQH
jgi:hypothetical protein